MKKNVKNIFHSKKGQLFFFATVVLLAIAFGTIRSQKKVVVDSTFSDLADNYILESPLSANQNAFSDFSSAFILYARTKDPHFGLVGVHTEGIVTVYNGVGQSILINNQYTLADNRSLTLNLTTGVDVFYSDHSFTIPVHNRTVSVLFASISVDATKFIVR